MWPRDNDPLREVEQFVRGAPVREVEEGVGTDDDEKLSVWFGAADAFERVDCVVWRGRSYRCLEVRGHEAWVGFAQERYHGEAVAVGGDSAQWLEGLICGRDEQDVAECIAVGCSLCDGQMAEVRWIE